MALLPLLTFIILYLLVSIISGDFYKVPITVAFLISSVVAIATLRGYTIPQRVKIFSRGASSENMMLMIWIFMLAGAFGVFNFLGLVLHALLAVVVRYGRADGFFGKHGTVYLLRGQTFQRLHNGGI